MTLPSVCVCLCVYAEEGCVVIPKAGTALIFNHDTLHEGLPVMEGVKYIIRTEIMYRRVDSEMLPDPLDYQKDDNYLTTVALYQKSWLLEQGNCFPYLVSTVQLHVYIYTDVCLVFTSCVFKHTHELIGHIRAERDVNIDSNYHRHCPAASYPHLVHTLNAKHWTNEKYKSTNPWC